MELYRKGSTLHVISVPRRTKLSEEFVVSSLRQAGLTDEQIRDFIAAAKA